MKTTMSATTVVRHIGNMRLSHSLSLDERRRETHQQQLFERSAAAGISTATVNSFNTDPATPLPQYYYHRYALYDGYLTGSEDGQPVAPLLGQVKAFDGGASDLQLGNLTSLLIYPDHVVFISLHPALSRIDRCGTVLVRTRRYRSGNSG